MTSVIWFTLPTRMSRFIVFACSLTYFVHIHFLISFIGSLTPVAFVIDEKKKPRATCTYIYRDNRSYVQTQCPYSTIIIIRDTEKNSHYPQFIRCDMWHSKCFCSDLIKLKRHHIDPLREQTYLLYILHVSSMKFQLLISLCTSDAFAHSLDTHTHSKGPEVKQFSRPEYALLSPFERYEIDSCQRWSISFKHTRHFVTVNVKKQTTEYTRFGDVIPSTKTVTRTNEDEWEAHATTKETTQKRPSDKRSHKR